MQKWNPELKRDVWHARYSEDGKRKRVRLEGCPRGDAGREFARAACDAHNEGVEDQDRARGFRRIGPKWLADQTARVWSKRTAATNEGRLARIVAFFGDSDPGAMTDDDVVEFVEHLAENMAPESINSMCSTLRSLLNHAGVQPDANIMKTTKTLTARMLTEAHEVDVWNPGEVERLLNGFKSVGGEDAVWLCALIAARTGMRRGEILGLKWSDVDFERGELRLRRAVDVCETGKPVETKVLKGRNGQVRRRTVPLDDTLGAALRRKQKEVERLRLQGYPDVEWVVPGHDGNVLRETTLESSWRRRHKHFAGWKVRPLKFHAFRHTFISTCLQSGVGAVQVSKWCGVKVETIFSNYAHLIPDEGGAGRLANALPSIALDA